MYRNLPLHLIGQVPFLPALNPTLQTVGGYYFMVGPGGEVIGHPRLFTPATPPTSNNTAHTNNGGDGGGNSGGNSGFNSGGDGIEYDATLEQLEPGLTDGQRQLLRGAVDPAASTTATSTTATTSTATSATYGARLSVATLLTLTLRVHDRCGVCS
jgi:hypothetical protein